MKKIYSFYLFLLFSFLLTKNSFSQNNDCGSNAGFETGTTAGWVCKYGYYGAGLCPVPQVTGVCPTFNTVVNNIGCINVNGIDAPLTTGVDRHTIMDTNAYGTGFDPNSISVLPVLPPGGGKYSFRLGDGVTGGTDTIAGYTGTCNGPGCYARAEAIRLTFAVNSQNAFFTYRYAAFLLNGGHHPVEQPRFEVLITRPNAGDSLIPGGHLIIVANNSDPDCPGAGANFHNGLGQWQYCDWTDVTTDLTNYIGDSISVEFRTSDCFPGTGIQSYVNGACTTTIENSDTCISGPNRIACPDSGTCRGTIVCGNTPGSHSAYAYIDAYCAATVGIKELANNVSIRIYPNPMTSSSIIEINGEQNAEVVIYDMVGKLLLRKKLIANKTEIQKGDLAQGIYIVRVNQYIKKLVVE